MTLALLEALAPLGSNGKKPVLETATDLVASHDLVGDVDVDVVAGKAELWPGDGHLKGSGWPRSIKWRGPGESHLNVDVGTGHARVRLEE